MGVDSGKGWCRGATKGALGFRQRGNRVRAKNEGVFGLKQGNVATFGCNIATFQRGTKPTLRRSREWLKPTSRHWDPTSRRSREVQNQRCDVEIQRRDVLEEGQTDVATLKANVATLQRRPKMEIIQQWSKVRENSPCAIVTLLNF